MPAPSFARRDRDRSLLENCPELLIFGDLGHQQAHQLIANYEVVGACDLGKLAIAIIQHLADDGERLAVLAGDLAQMQKGYQGP